MEAQPKVGKITVAPGVLETIVRFTALAVPGVARLVAPAGVSRLLRHDGVELRVRGNTVHVEVHVVAEQDVSLLRVSRQVQAEVMRAIQDLVGMEVEAVDVCVEDVAGRPNGAAAVVEA